MKQYPPVKKIGFFGKSPTESVPDKTDFSRAREKYTIFFKKPRAKKAQKTSKKSGETAVAISKKQVKESLIDQLERKGANIQVFRSLVEDYMKLWDTKEALLKDIKKRGISFSDYSSAGKPMVKQNPSTKEVVAVNAQMLKILAQLDITTGNLIGDDDDVM